MLIATIYLWLHRERFGGVQDKKKSYCWQPISLSSSDAVIIAYTLNYVIDSNNVAFNEKLINNIRELFS